MAAEKLLEIVQDVSGPDDPMDTYLLHPGPLVFRSPPSSRPSLRFVVVVVLSLLVVKSFFLPGSFHLVQFGNGKVC